ncbi:uncharacterized protein At1g01500-like [Arachis stenosperma]|uniref:uncharacterized protein At1g01500-like n=1 Tax=Arachis stenosperma TaxID=217475 RepID=UPI0025AC8109|nr:uncharacterized protein At1g01500-like [Arachis stenosperma]
MENCYKANGNIHRVSRQNKHPFSIRDQSLPCFDIRVFLVRVCKSDLDNSAPEVLKLKCVSPNPGTLLKVNGVRAAMQSEGVSSLLKRDRVDKKSKEVTFVSTDSIKMSSNVKFEVFDKDVLLVSGVLELCNSNGSVNGQRWSMNCESIIIPGTSFFKSKKFMLPGSTLPTIEVYIAGSFLDTPIVLTKTLHLSSQIKHTRMGTFSTNLENETSAPSTFTLQAADNMSEKPEEEDNNIDLYQRRAYVAAEEEDGEVSWFNAGVRVGVGIGLSVCIGIGIGVGVLVKTYQGTTRNFRRRLL